jgi:hypothetical protein
MSKIVAFRDKIVEQIREKVTDLAEVDWYDGLFDEQDIKDWSLKTPCAFVSVTCDKPVEHLPTKEMNVDLKCVVAVVVQDYRDPRDSDKQTWSILEQIATLANLHKFNFPDASLATAVKFRRIRDPELRREGVALGIVEWSSGVTIGENRVLARDFYYLNGVLMTDLPEHITAETIVRNDVPIVETETVSLPYPDEACPGDPEA